MNSPPLSLSRDDYSKLRLLLAAALYSNSGAALRKLRDELDRAAVVDPGSLPDDVVAMESTVQYEDLATGETEEYVLTYPELADVGRRRLSILAPIGTALIGCRVGDVVTWATPGGLRRLRVRRVTRLSPEAEPSGTVVARA
jgi:regulator of nucleoside diphosphate kinase